MSCGPLATLNLEQLPLSWNCIQGKMTKRSFTVKGVRAEGCLDLIHSNVCGPVSMQEVAMSISSLLPMTNQDMDMCT